MRTTCNPGRRLEVTGSFRLQRGQSRGLAGEILAVGDVESGHIVTLQRLFEHFLEDPSETVTGPVRIIIEAGGS